MANDDEYAEQYNERNELIKRSKAKHDQKIKDYENLIGFVVLLIIILVALAHALRWFIHWLIY